MQKSSETKRLTIGLFGFGAFGRLIVKHLARDFDFRIHDPACGAGAIADAAHATFDTLANAAAQPIIILATPVNRMQEAARAIASHLQPGALVLDVGSVKILPAAIMTRELPSYVEIIGTHPLFGPQSAAHGVAGLKIALCPIRGQRARRVAAYLRKALQLTTILTTPDAHDREAATVQGLTHLIAKVLVRMEPLPSAMTTRSFDLIMQAVGMVRDDAPEVFQAIERLNPHTEQVRQRFFKLAAELDAELQSAPRPRLQSVG